jgi:hypothetical protein
LFKTFSSICSKLEKISTSSFVWKHCRAEGDAAEAVKKIEIHSTFPVFNVSCNAVVTGGNFSDFYIFYLKNGKIINTTLDFPNDIAIYHKGRK